VFLSEQCAVSKLTTSVQSAVFQPWHRPLIHCSVDNMLFEVSPEIDCSGVSGCHCCHGNHATGSKQISKPFTLVNWVLNNVSFYQKWLVNVVIWRRFVILITAVWFFKGSVCVIKQSNRCVWQTFYIHQWLFVLSLTLSNGWHISVWDSLRRWCWIRITLTSSVRLECRTVDC